MKEEEKKLLDQVSDEAILERADEIHSQQVTVTKQEVNMKCRAKTPDGEDVSCDSKRSIQKERPNGTTVYECKECGRSWNISQGGQFS